MMNNFCLYGITTCITMVVLAADEKVQLFFLIIAIYLFWDTSIILGDAKKCPKF